MSILRLFLRTLCFYVFCVQSVEGGSRDNSWNPSHIGDGAVRQIEGSSGATSSSEASGHVTRLASIDSFDSKWYPLNPSASCLGSLIFYFRKNYNLFLARSVMSSSVINTMLFLFLGKSLRSRNMLYMR